MPAFNSERYLADAIGSILIQSHSNLELIIIDGSAHKKCAEIALAFSDPRIRYFHRFGEGLASARNFGSEQACGSYIANLDADDIAVPERLSEQLKYLQNNDCQICGSWMKVLGRGNSITQYPLSDKDIKFSMLFYSPIPNPTILGEVTLFKENRYNNSTAEDYDLWTRLAEQGIVFGSIPAPLVSYRTHTAQTSIVKFEEMVRDSEPVAKRYAESYLPKKQFEAMEKFSFGMSYRYSLTEAVQLCELTWGLAYERSVSTTVLTRMFPRFFRKITPMNPAVLVAYLKMARKAEIPIWTEDTIKLGIQSLLALNKDSRLFSFLKRLARTCMIRLRSGI